MPALLKGSLLKPREKRGRTENAKERRREHPARYANPLSAPRINRFTSRNGLPRVADSYTGKRVLFTLRACVDIFFVIFVLSAKIYGIYKLGRAGLLVHLFIGMIGIVGYGQVNSWSLGEYGREIRKSV